MERSGAEWSGVERSGAEWSGVEWGGGLTKSLNSIGRETKAGTTRSNVKLKRDRV